MASQALTAEWTALADTSPNKTYQLQNRSDYDVQFMTAENQPELDATGNVLTSFRSYMSVGTARHGSGESIWVRSTAGNNSGIAFRNIIYNEGVSVG